ncbi:GNAT family acetyltransferase [Sphingobium sp. C100]|jgi:RimJ/RimL family protein N-acetyltransferase|uniref:GNAT family N-acetyltransferase n=1 Tax=Sphingobium sp. C100 TaxID=1207055 RepID=UPI0003D59BF7|nr:GNAT family N-acetyltransferase [Sphingobium sp. C100]ETI64882.1 GNAT family acetyltransferase [Sphingobium sp. C100]
MFARTPRLLLRPGWMEDAQALARTINDPAILRNLTRAPSPYGMDDAKAFLSLPHHPHLPRLLAFTRTQGAPRLIGGCGVHLDEQGAPELGYWIARPCWGLGFATEAARAVLGMARASGVRNIRAGHFTDNPASGNVLRKLGFCFTGETRKRHSLGRNALVDCLIFEEGEGGGMNDDPAMDLYRDAVPAMAA